MKAWWKSKTVWVNVLGVFALALEQGGVVPIDGDTAALALAGVNIALRLLTKTAVTVREQKPAAVEPAGV